MSKRILITGYTSRMSGSKRLQADYITFSYLLEDMLKELGHQVERRSVDIGENLTWKYDFAFCGVAPLSSMTSGKIPQTHYAMDAMARKHAVYADDWSFCGFGKSVRYALPRWEKFCIHKGFADKNLNEQTKEWLSTMIEIQNPLNNAPVLAPMFPWGDHSFLMKDNYRAKLFSLDPSPFLKFHTVKIPPPDQKAKQWVMAALSNHSPWVNRQRFNFPVLYVGNKRMEGAQVLNESLTVQLFANSFGVLSAGYPSAGSGWWRTRYLNAAWAESLIYSDIRDSATMGEAYKGSPREFESLRGRAYIDRVNAQREWLEANISKKEESLAVLEKIMK